MANLAEVTSCKQEVLFLNDEIGILNNVVTQSNKLIGARYRLTSNENRIVKMLLSTVQLDDQEFKFYRFKTSYIVRLLGLKSKGNYKSIIKTIEGLMNKSFTIIEDNNRAITLAWVASAEYLADKGIIEIELSQKLKPYLIDLKGYFTPIQLANIMALNSYHSARIYEILKSHDYKKKKITLKLSELRWQLGLEPDDYPRYSNFKQRILKPAQEEINNNTDISFEYEEIKIKRKTESLIFYITSQDNRRSFIKNIFSLRQIYPTNVQLDKLETCLEGIKEEQITKIAIRLEQALDDGKIKSPISYLLSHPTEIIDAILNDYFLPEKPKKEKTQKKIEDKYELYNTSLFNG